MKDRLSKLAWPVVMSVGGHLDSIILIDMERPTFMGVAPFSRTRLQIKEKESEKNISEHASMSILACS